MRRVNPLRRAERYGVTARSRFLWLAGFSVSAATIIGLIMGIALGAVSGYFDYYVVRQTLLGFLGGVSAVVFLSLLRLVFRPVIDERRPRRAQLAWQIIYVLTGFLAGATIFQAWRQMPRIVDVGLWLWIYPFGSAVLFPLIAAVADVFEESRLEHARAVDLFSRYVSDAVAQRILAERRSIKLEGERRPVAAFCVDIRGFSRMTRELGAEQAVQMLNEYFEQMIDIVFEYEGMVNKFIGDGMMIIFGAPLAVRDETYRAICLAMAMNRALESVNQARRTSGKAPIRVGIGIDYGEVILGNIGSERRMEYTAIGVPVNASYYLSSLAAPDQILITEAAYQQVRGRVGVTPVDKMRLKGWSELVQIYAVQSLLAGDCRWADASL